MSDEVGELIGLGIGLAAVGIGTEIFMKSIDNITDVKKIKKKKKMKTFKELF